MSVPLAEAPVDDVIRVLLLVSDQMADNAGKETRWARAKAEAAAEAYERARERLIELRPELDVPR